VKVIRDDLWLCHDCHLAASGADETIVDQGQAKATEDGLIALAEIGDLVYQGDPNCGDECRCRPRCTTGCEEFSRRRCDCCGPALAGSRHRYAILGPEAK
jgi:hypothetical protein